MGSLRYIVASGVHFMLLRSFQFLSFPFASIASLSLTVQELEIIIFSELTISFVVLFIALDYRDLLSC